MSCPNAPVGTLSSDQVRQVLATAQQAPALRRFRPWRFHCTQTTIELLLKLPEDRWGEDDDHREARVACGAALLNLRLAVRSCGVEPVVHMMPEMDRPSLLAAVEIDGRRPTTPEGLELSVAIGLLETHTRNFATGSLPDALIVELRYAARAEQAWIALLAPSALPALRNLVDQSGRLQLLGPAAHVVVIGTLQDDPSSRLRAGQAMQRVLLTAAMSGMSTSFVAMPSHSSSNRDQLRQLIGGGLWPQVLLQIGHEAA